MSENEDDGADSSENKEGNIEATIRAATGLVKAIPVYDDAIQPAAKEVGKSLETIAKTINVVMAPLRLVVWGSDQFENFFNTFLAQKLRNTPEEEIITPKPNIAGPALEALRFVGQEEELCDVYANLLASSMDVKTESKAHPAYVEIIKQLTPDEAKLMKLFSQDRPFPLIDVVRDFGPTIGARTMLRNFSILGEEARCEKLVNVPSYLDNLNRLGLIDLPDSKRYTKEGTYEELKEHATVVAMLKFINSIPDSKGVIHERTVAKTNLGMEFISTCITDHASTRPDIA